MIGRIHTDIFFQERYMLNEVNAQIKLIRSNDAFCLMATGGQQFKVDVTAASLLIRKIKLSPSIFLAHAKTLENGTAKYIIRRLICKSFTVPAGYLDVSHEKLFSGPIPVRLISGSSTIELIMAIEREIRSTSSIFRSRKSGSIWMDSYTA
jgi:hypothetical protein